MPSPNVFSRYVPSSRCPTTQNLILGPKQNANLAMGGREVMGDDPAPDRRHGPSRRSEDCRSEDALRRRLSADGSRSLSRQNSTQRTGIPDLPTELLHEIGYGYLSEKDRIALHDALSVTKNGRRCFLEEATALSLVTKASEVKDLHGFKFLLGKVKDLTRPAFREKVWKVLGARILRLPEHEQQSAIDAFLASQTGHAPREPDDSLLDELIDAAKVGIQELAYRESQAMVIAQMEACNGVPVGELATRFGITDPEYIKQLINIVPPAEIHDEANLQSIIERHEITDRTMIDLLQSRFYQFATVAVDAGEDVEAVIDRLGLTDHRDNELLRLRAR